MRPENIKQQPSFSSPSKPAAAVFKAAGILQDNLAAPPRLPDLARQVGMSHSSLNKGFHHHFGTTVYGYLRRLRLEKARQLLCDSHITITDTAFTVGYESLPSFSRAFSIHFGICPRRFLSALRNAPDARISDAHNPPE